MADHRTPELVAFCEDPDARVGCCPLRKNLRRLKEYAEDVDWMDALTRILPAAVTNDAVAVRLRRLEEAVVAAEVRAAATESV